MSINLEEALKKLGWSDGFQIPIANAENKELEEELAKLSLRKQKGKHSLDIISGRLEALTDHFKYVVQENEQTQKLITAHHQQLETVENALYTTKAENQNAQRCIKTSTSQLKDAETVQTDRKNDLQKLLLKAERMKAEMDWDSEALKAWEEALKKRDEDIDLMKRFFQEDDRRYNQLEAKRQRLRADLVNVQARVEKMATSTYNAEQMIERSGKTIKQLTVERDALIKQWKDTVQMLQQRDSDIMRIQEEIYRTKEVLEKEEERLEKENKFLANEKKNNRELESEINEANNIISKYRRDLADLYEYLMKTNTERRLNQEYIYAELIQWKSCDEGRVLSTFRTTLDDLLYPSTFRGSIMGVNIDLLMEPTDIFPGTIAPKLEVGTKTTVEEKLFEPYCTDPSITLITPKALACKPAMDNRSVPRKVCHSIGYSRSQKKDKEAKRKIKKPPFKFGKVPDDLILRTNPNVVVKDYFNEKFSNKPTCYCSEGKNVDYGPENLYNIENCDTRTEILKHKKDCSTCSFYDSYFSRNPSRVQSNGTRCSANAGTKVPSHVCSYCSRHLNNSIKYHVPSKTGSPCDSDPEYIDSNGRICFCVPREPANSLAQQLHEKLVRTLENNSKLLQKYIDC